VGIDQLPIETPSLRIRQFVPGDAAAVFALSIEPAWRTWLPSQVYSDEAHARSAIEFLIGQYQDPGHPARGPYVLAIEHRADGALLGHVGFSPLDGEVEVGFSIGEAHQRRGYATEAIVSGSRWALEAFGLERVLAIAAVANVASRRALARARFVYEGDRVMPFQGEEQSVCVYVLTRDAGAAPRPRGRALA
jgi:RimJ/RimL family protein N-acetyltransferase